MRRLSQSGLLGVKTVFALMVSKFDEPSSQLPVVPSAAMPSMKMPQWEQRGYPACFVTGFMDIVHYGKPRVCRVDWCRGR